MFDAGYFRSFDYARMLTNDLETRTITCNKKQSRDAFAGQFEALVVVVVSDSQRSRRWQRECSAFGISGESGLGIATAEKPRSKRSTAPPHSPSHRSRAQYFRAISPSRSPHLARYSRDAAPELALEYLLLGTPHKWHRQPYLHAIKHHMRFVACDLGGFQPRARKSTVRLHVLGGDNQQYVDASGYVITLLNIRLYTHATRKFIDLCRA